MAEFSEPYQSCTGLFIRSDRLEGERSFAPTSSFSKTYDNGEVSVSAINLSDNQKTLNNQTEIVHFKFLNKTQADILIEKDPELISLTKMQNPDDFGAHLNQLIQPSHFKKFDTPTGRPSPDYSKLWRLTPGTCNDFSVLTHLERKVYDQFWQLQRQGEMDLKDNDANKLEFSTKISWDSCVLNADQKANLKNFSLNIMIYRPSIALMWAKTQKL